MELRQNTIAENLEKSCLFSKYVYTLKFISCVVLFYLWFDELLILLAAGHVEILAGAVRHTVGLALLTHVR